MSLECYTTVSDLAICQRCPALFAYRVHWRDRTVWRVGIKGSEAYGSVFHKEISQKFFETASNPHSKLYEKICKASSDGARALERLVRENFFVPFVERKEKYFSSSQILAMANAVRVWIQGILIFFDDSQPVFMRPEGNLHGSFESGDAKLNIKGRYDALIFNPAKVEARLFEFKGFRKSDITVPLAQSLIYAWLIEKSSGILPSIEIIYLDEQRPEIFDSQTVREMISSGLPGLFNAALDIILLRRLPEMQKDKNLCTECKFRFSCKNNIKKIFSKKRRGASMMSLLVFFFSAMVITAQVFFLSNLSAESVKEDRDLQSVRMQLARLVYDVENMIKQDKIRAYSTTKKEQEDHKITFYKEIEANYKNFYEKTSGTLPKDLKDRLTGYPNRVYFNVNVHKLDYKYKSEEYKSDEWKNIDVSQRIFPSMENHYLIRISKDMPAGNVFMVQVLVESDDAHFRQKTYEEIWY